jgi:hypothetical protein
VSGYPGHFTRPFPRPNASPYSGDGENPDTPKRPRDPARPTRSKANREQLPPIAPALADLLNPAIKRGDAGVGSQTGLQQPPDNSRDRRADAAAAHRARASNPAGPW